MKELIEKLKTDIIAQLNLQGITPDKIDDNAPLFGDGLGLDSIDALELIVMVERNFGIKIKDQEAGKKAMASVAALAAFIEENRSK